MRTPGFGTLVRIIIDQQVSTAAGAAIWAKLKKACGGSVTPKRVATLGEQGLRAVGCSGQKARYVLGIAEATAARTLHFGSLHKAEDATVRDALIAFKGIGTWTADIYLMFGMGRPDVWPAGDLALQIGVQMLHGLKSRPTPQELERIAEAWRPYRSSAAVLVWHYYTTHRTKKKAGAQK
jgi:DNA-3-methyladenine glycosylase II